jgi:hypothetical protein
VNFRWKSWISLRGYYTLNYAKADTSGPTFFPSNPFDISDDYVRTTFDVRHRAFVGGAINFPHNISLYPFMLATSGTPYSITLSRDLIGSSQFNQRPSFATATSPANATVDTRFGTFNTLPQPVETIVPIDSLTGPPHFSLNLRLVKTWGFGGEVSSGANQGGGPVVGGGGRGGPGGGGTRGGFGMGGPINGGGGTGRRYNFSLGIIARNVFNYENLAVPTAVLNPPISATEMASASPFFGRSNALAGGPFSSTSASRLIYLQLGFSF